MLELKSLSNDELIEKLNDLQTKLRYLKHGISSVDHQKLIMQCEGWCMEIELELQERLTNADMPEAGVVATIGEEVYDPEEHKKPQPRWISKKGKENGKEE